MYYHIMLCPATGWKVFDGTIAEAQAYAVSNGMEIYLSLESEEDRETAWFALL